MVNVLGEYPDCVDIARAASPTPSSRLSTPLLAFFVQRVYRGDDLGVGAMQLHGYLAPKKSPPPRTLQKTYADGPPAVIPPRATVSEPGQSCFPPARQVRGHETKPDLIAASVHRRSIFSNNLHQMLFHNYEYDPGV